VALLALSKSGSKAPWQELRVLRAGLWPMLRRYDAKLVTWALGALIALEFARVGAMLLSGHPGRQHAAIPVISPVAHRSAGVNIAGIVSAHIFGISAPGPSVQDPANAPRSTANLILAGTIATEDPQHGKAIIGDPGQGKVYSVGQQIGGATLRWVYLDYVVLDRSGSLESLALPRVRLAARESATARSRPAPARTAVASPTAMPAPASPEPEVAVIDKVVESEASNNGVGDFLGIRVLPAENRATFFQSGLKEGDIVVAVNGTKLTDADHGQEIWKQVSTGTTVTVMRSGKSQDITLNLAP
jgi:type II secretion system protein C